jgi:hypothetical protein
LDLHGNARRNDTLKQAAESRQQSPPKKSVRIAPPLLPIAIQAVYSLQIIVPVVQRIEQGFPKGKMAFLQEFADVIGCAQIALSKCLG